MDDRRKQIGPYEDSDDARKPQRGGAASLAASSVGNMASTPNRSSGSSTGLPSQPMLFSSGKGAVTGLLTTEGFRDILEIGRQFRSNMYDLNFSPSAPTFLVPGSRRKEVRERIDAQGKVVVPDGRGLLGGRYPDRWSNPVLKRSPSHSYSPFSIPSTNAWLRMRCDELRLASQSRYRAMLIRHSVNMSEPA